MKIGIDLRMYRSSVAGIGRYSQNLIKNLLLLDKDNEYTFFVTPDDEKELKSQLKIENYKLKIIVVDIPHFSLAEQTKLPKIIAQENCDLVFFTNTNYPVRYRGKFISMIPDLTLYFYPQTARKSGFIREKAFNYVLKKAAKNSAKIITISENTKRDIINVCKVNQEKVAVTYLAADDKTFAEATPAEMEKLKKQFNIDQPVILYVGQFRAHKNIPNLVRAFDQIRKDQPAKLVLVGKPDPNYTELEEAIDKSPFKSDIIRPGFVSDTDLSAWYQLSTLYAFPSLYEGFGLPGLEAMAAKTAVVSSDRTSLPEIYGKGAIYFDPLNIFDMADKIKKVLVDPKLRESLIAEGNQVLLQYSWRKTAEETLDLFRQVEKSEILNSKS